MFCLFQDLIEEMKDELSGDFEEAIVAILMASVEFDAYCLHDAMAGIGTDESVLNGILTSRSAKVGHFFQLIR